MLVLRLLWVVFRIAILDHIFLSSSFCYERLHRCNGGGHSPARASSIWWWWWWCWWWWWGWPPFDSDSGCHRWLPSSTPPTTITTRTVTYILRDVCDRSRSCCFPTGINGLYSSCEDHPSFAANIHTLKDLCMFESVQNLSTCRFRVLQHSVYM